MHGHIGQGTILSEMDSLNLVKGTIFFCQRQISTRLVQYEFYLWKNWLVIPFLVIIPSQFSQIDQKSKLALILEYPLMI